MQKEHQLNAIYCKMMEHDTVDGQSILQLAIPRNASRTDKDCTVLLQRYDSLC